MGYTLANLEDNKAVAAWMAIVVTSCLAYVARLFVAKPPPVKGPDGAVLKPYGSTYGKNYFAYFMAFVAKLREKKKAKRMTAKQLEAFHKPDLHKYWNESYYWSGSETGTKNRIISRISRRGMNAEKMYIILALDLEDYGVLTLEEDNVPLHRKENGPEDVTYIYENPSGLNLTYSCIEPMHKWRIEYKGMMMKGFKAPGDPDDAEYSYVEIDLIYTNKSAVFWYMRDEHPMTLAKNLSEEPWGYRFFKYCLERSHNHCHVEAFGKYALCIFLLFEPLVLTSS